MKPLKLYPCKVLDMMSPRLIEYPVDPKHITHRYDFHLSRDSTWFYVNSFDDIAYAVWGAHARTVEGIGESWRVVDVKKNLVVKWKFNDVIERCALCNKQVWLRDSYSPGDELHCAECDTEVTGRKHLPTLNVKTQPPPKLTPCPTKESKS